jgi:hypothetical protein
MVAAVLFLYPARTKNNISLISTLSHIIAGNKSLTEEMRKQTKQIENYENQFGFKGEYNSNAQMWQFNSQPKLHKQ